MKKSKFTGLCISVIALLNAVMVTSCNKGGSEPDPEPTPSGNPNYIIDVSDFTLDAAEVGELYTVSLPQVIDRSGEVTDAFKVKVKSATFEDGSTEIVVANKFTPKKIGEWTLVFTCNSSDVKESSTTMVCQDTVSPIIDASGVQSFLFLSDTNVVPSLLANDAGGIDESSKKVVIKNSNGEEVSVTNNVINFTEEGNYTYNFEVKDTSGNIATLSKSVYVTAQTKIDGRVTYFDASTYALQIVKSYDRDLPTLDWETSFTDPDGNPTVKITPKSDTEYIDFGVVSAIQDWSQYDYFSIWVYNPTSYFLAFGLVGLADSDSYILNPNSWNYICRSSLTNDLLDCSKKAHKCNNLSQIICRIYDRFVMDGKEIMATLKPSHNFYISNISLHKKDSSTIVYSLGEKDATSNISVHQKYMEYTWETSNEYVFPGDSFSTKFTLVNTVNSFNVALTDPSNLNVSNPRYLLNVYNPNDYDIIIIDCPCDAQTQRGVGSCDNYSTIIKAKEGAKVLVQCDTSVQTKYAYLMALKLDGSKVQDGFSIFFGNVFTSDNYNEQSPLYVTNWNEVNGDPNIWTKYRSLNN